MRPRFGPSRRTADDTPLRGDERLCWWCLMRIVSSHMVFGQQCSRWDEGSGIAIDLMHKPCRIHHGSNAFKSDCPGQQSSSHPDGLQSEDAEHNRLWRMESSTSLVLVVLTMRSLHHSKRKVHTEDLSVSAQDVMAVVGAAVPQTMSSSKRTQIPGAIQVCWCASSGRVSMPRLGRS